MTFPNGGFLALLLLSPVICGAAPAEDASAASRDDAAFALAFKAELREPGNQFFSPYSISSALTLLHLGARGKTAREIESALRTSLPPRRLAPAMAALQSQLLHQRGVELSAASALWPSAKAVLSPAFVDGARRFYGATPEVLNYRDAAKAAQRINAWVDHGTKGKIKDLISAEDLPPKTLLVLTNAVYFKGKWADKFRKEDTQDQPFAKLGGDSVTVPLMSATRFFRYLDAGSAQIAELPYKGDRFSMVVILPKEKLGLRALEATLSPEVLNDWLDRLFTERVELYLPRFKLELSLDMTPILKSMGMKSAFTDEADFSGISAKIPLKVNAAIHKAFVAVDEEGTEAAAASGITMTMGASLQPPPVFRADHPFLFLIRDRKTGAILFFGRLEDPR